MYPIFIVYRGVNRIQVVVKETQDGGLVILINGAARDFARSDVFGLKKYL